MRKSGATKPGKRQSPQACREEKPQLLTSNDCDHALNDDYAANQSHVSDDKA